MYDILKLVWFLIQKYVLTAWFALKQYQFKKKLIRIRAKDTQLTHLDLSQTGLSYLNIIELCSALDSNTILTSLDVSGNDIDNAGAKLLAARTTLKSLKVSYSLLEGDGVLALAANTQLRSLDVSHSRINSADAQALAANQTLTSLNVSATHIDDAVAKLLAASTTLKSLNISHNCMGNDGAQAMAANTNLTSLNVSENYIDNDGAKVLAANTSLTSINVSRNYIGDDILLLLRDTIIRNIDARKLIVALHAFASIANGTQATQRLPADLMKTIGLMLITDTGCLNDIERRAAVRGSRSTFFQPAVLVDSTIEPIQPAPTNI